MLKVIKDCLTSGRLIVWLKVLINRAALKIKSNNIVLLSGIFIAGFLLRIHKLGYHDFWYDEIHSILASSSFGYGRPPLYYILLHYWINIFGVSELSLRFPSLVFSAASVLVSYFLARRIFNSKKIGFYTALCVALSPFLLWYAQEVRSYSMALFLGVVTTLAFYRALIQQEKKMWAVFILLSIAGLYTNYFYIFLFFAQVAYAISLKRPRASFWLPIVFFAVIFGFLPHLHKFVETFWYLERGFWVNKPSLQALIITLHDFNLGYNSFLIFYVASDFLAVLFLIASLRRAEVRAGIVFCLFLSILPILLVFLFSRLTFSIYLDRGLIIFTPFYYMMIAAGIDSLRNKLVKFSVATVAFFLVLVGITGYYNDWLKHPYWNGGIYIKRPVRPLVEFIEREFKSGDIVGFTNVSVMPSFSFYGRREGSPPYSFFDFVKGDPRSPISFTECFTFYSGEEKIPLYYFFGQQIFDSNLKRPEIIHDFSMPVHHIDSLDVKRIWIISSSWERDGSMDENSRLVNQWLANHFNLELHTKLEGAHIFRYSK